MAKCLISAIVGADPAGTLLGLERPQVESELRLESEREIEGAD